MRLELWILILHVAANMVWVGSMLAVVVLMRPIGGREEALGQSALRVYRTLAVPGFVGSFVFGTARLLMDLRHHMVTTHFMHVKLLLALIAIAAHHWMGARARRSARGERGGPAVVAAAVFGACCLGAVVLAILKPF